MAGTNDIPETVNVEPTEQKCDGVVPCEWESYFLNRDDCLVKKGVVNLPRTKIAVLSGTDIKHGGTDILTILSGEEQLRNTARFEKDKAKVRQLQASSEANKMTFTVFHLGEYFHDFRQMRGKDLQNCQEKMIQDIRDCHPTIIVLPFCGAKPHSSCSNLDIVSKTAPFLAIAYSRVPDKRKLELF